MQMRADNNENVKSQQRQQDALSKKLRVESAALPDVAFTPQ